MIRGSRAAHRVAVVTAAVGLLAATASPVSAATAAGDGNVCTDYGATATAPKGFIPRDDLQIVKKGRLALLPGQRQRDQDEAGPPRG